MLKESNNRRLDGYSVRNSVLIITHITFRDCRVHISSDNLSRNSCMDNAYISQHEKLLVYRLCRNYTRRAQSQLNLSDRSFLVMPCLVATLAARKYFFQWQSSLLRRNWCLWGVFTHVARNAANLWEQKNRVHKKVVQLPEGCLAAVMLCENALHSNLR